MPRFETLADWLYWQETLHPKKIDLGLERVAAVASRMGVLHPRHTVVTVGGTNGKGSSVAMLEAMLSVAGYRVGSYTSPHLLRYNERIRINGVEVDDETLCAAFQAVDERREGVSLSYFEFGTLAALQVLNNAALDIALLEVGLGGRLDAVNVIDPDIALVTSIGIDHTQWLGNDRESIGREKAGIFRQGRPAICADSAPPSSLAEAAGMIGAHWYGLKEQFHAVSGKDAWHWTGPGRRCDSLPFPALAGTHQLENASGVLMVLELLRERFPVSKAAIIAGLRSVTLPARCQVIPGPVETVLDVAHNPHGAARLAELLRNRPCKGLTRLVLGMLDDKDVSGFSAVLTPEVDHWYLAGLNIERGLTADALQQRMSESIAPDRMHRFPDVESACQQVHRVAMTGDRIIVCGSFYTVAAAMGCDV
ncbi:MAG: bifunctional tetrahydrofolate synthase/dihydrofolate synthase [Pseudomonadota bacterium]|nr:bifunctional tetrahydrofolate synthase/dihydrofolate synthase [Pseudomonadota bacterium]